MITNFEAITFELTDEEMKFLPAVISGFNSHTADNPIKENEIVEAMNKYLASQGSKMKFNGSRLRKYVNYIRANAMSPLIATSKGYYVSSDPSTLRDQIQSLEERARSIMTAAAGLRSMLGIIND